MHHGLKLLDIGRRQTHVAAKSQKSPAYAGKSPSFDEAMFSAKSKIKPLPEQNASGTKPVKKTERKKESAVPEASDEAPRAAEAAATPDVEEDRRLAEADASEETDPAETSAEEESSAQTAADAAAEISAEGGTVAAAALKPSDGCEKPASAGTTSDRDNGALSPTTPQKAHAKQEKPAANATETAAPADDIAAAKTAADASAENDQNAEKPAAHDKARHRAAASREALAAAQPDADEAAAAKLQTANPSTSPVASEKSAEPALPPPELNADSKSTVATNPLAEVASVTPGRETPHAEAAPAAQDSPASTPADPMDQIVLGLKTKFDARNGKAEIQLDPPNLGHIKVSISLDQGALTAEFQSASDLVRDLLKNNLDRLKSVLQGQGVAVDRLAVDAPPAPAAGGQQNSFGSANHDGRSAGQYQPDGRQGRNRNDGDSFTRLFRQTQNAVPFETVA